MGAAIILPHSALHRPMMPPVRYNHTVCWSALACKQLSEQKQGTSEPIKSLDPTSGMFQVETNVEKK